MDIPVGLGGINILVGVTVLLSFVMFLNFCHIIEGGQVLVTGKGAVDSVISGHKNLTFSTFETGRERRFPPLTDYRL